MVAICSNPRCSKLTQFIVSIIVCKRPTSPTGYCEDHVDEAQEEIKNRGYSSIKREYKQIPDEDIPEITTAVASKSSNNKQEGKK